MTKKAKKHQEPTKAKLHIRNLHREKYNLSALVNRVPPLKAYIIQNVKGEDTIKFADPEAVMLLNKALLLTHYDIDHWELPSGYLCPPIPGRADYIHHASDLLAGKNFGKIPKAHLFDAGVGANCIYPILGTVLYDWTFVGSEIDGFAIAHATDLLHKNERLQDKVQLRQQVNHANVLKGVLKSEELFDLVICNPPFHQSAQDAQEQADRKVKNLNKGKALETQLNFGGQINELWCPGGERRFISTLINESKEMSKQCFWFTSLVSKAAHLKALQDSLDFHQAVEVRTINMTQGNKSSRILAWTFLTKEEQVEWRKSRWEKK